MPSNNVASTRNNIASTTTCAPVCSWALHFKGGGCGRFRKPKRFSDSPLFFPIVQCMHSMQILETPPPHPPAPLRPGGCSPSARVGSAACCSPFLLHSASPAEPLPPSCNPRHEGTQEETVGRLCQQQDDEERDQRKHVLAERRQGNRDQDATHVGQHHPLAGIPSPGA